MWHSLLAMEIEYLHSILYSHFLPGIIRRN